MRILLRYSYGFYCTAEVRGLRDAHGSISPRVGQQPHLRRWRSVFAAHAEKCRGRGECPGPLISAGMDLVEADTGKVVQTLYAPFSDWETSGAGFRPPGLNPNIMPGILKRLADHVAPTRGAAGRSARFRVLRERLAVWGVRVVEVQTLGEFAKLYPGGLRWGALPGARPTQWNSSLLAAHLTAPGFVLARPVREQMEALHALPEPAGSVARAANMSALSTMAVRSALFGHPSHPAPIQLVARLSSCGVLPAAVIPAGDCVSLVVFKPDGWPECGPS